MNELLKTRMFSLLSEPSPVTNEQMKNVYEHFMEQVRTTVGQPEADFSEVFRKLSNTRVELVFIEMLYRYGQGEKCPKIRLY